MSVQLEANYDVEICHYQEDLGSFFELPTKLGHADHRDKPEYFPGTTMLDTDTSMQRSVFA